MNKTIRTAAAFVLIFGLMAVGFTYFSIERAKESAESDILPSQSTMETTTETTEPTENMTIELVEKPIDLYGTYDQNDIIINEVIDKKGEAEVRYPEISGLKNKDVENKLNEELRKNMDELLAEYDKINYANYYVRSNFSNVISLSLHVGSDEKYDQKYLNYELVNGEALKVEDLFMKDTDILSVVREAFYKASASENWYEAEGQFVSPDENTVYKYVKSYMDSGVKEFNFTPSEIYFHSNGRMAGVKMVDFYDEISIYYKYMTDESIYENDDIGFENIFTCAEGNYEPFELIDYGYGEENLWYDVTVWQGFNSDIEEDKAEKINVINESERKEIYKLLDEYKEKAKNNKDKFFIFFAKPGHYVLSLSEYVDGEWKYTYSDALEISSNIQIFEMPIELYEGKYRDEIIDTYRYEYFGMRGGAYLDTENLPAEVELTQIDGTKLRNYMNGEVLDDFSDIFNEGYDHMSFVKEWTVQNLTGRGYSLNEAEEIFGTAEIMLKGGNIKISMDVLEFPYSLSITQFDINQLKIF